MMTKMIARIMCSAVTAMRKRAVKGTLPCTHSPPSRKSECVQQET